MEVIPPDYFVMGTPPEHCLQHVAVSRCFMIGKYPVTWALWKSVMSYDNSLHNIPYAPIDNVTWVECLLFCNKLSEQEGLEPVYELSQEVLNEVQQEKHFSRNYSLDQMCRSDGWGEPKIIVHWNKNGYRLPTEAEWFLAARSDKRTQNLNHETLSQMAWFGEDLYTGTTHPVGQKSPNDLGIYDMFGNVWEWTWDGFMHSTDTYCNGIIEDPHGNGKAERLSLGGGYNKLHWRRDVEPSSIFEMRESESPSVRRRDIGFRLVRTIVPFEDK